jgi:type I restriction enzyme S subunit
MRRIPLRIPPLAEQVRIVDAIESYLTRLDDAAATLERVQRNLKRYRTSVLKAAVEGRLVPTEAELARTEGRDYEPASVLLERILAERRRRWEEAELAKMKAKGTNPKDDRWKAKYREPGAPDTSHSSSLPEGWCWATAEALSDEARPITYGVVKLGAATPGGVPTLRSSNVRRLRLELDYVKPISNKISAAYRRTVLEGGEVLVTVRGTLGGVIAVPSSCAGFNISREVAMIALVEPRMSPIVATFIGSAVLQNWMMRRTRGIAYTGINIATLKQLPVPLPPLEEQLRVVEAIEHHLSIASAAETACVRNQQRCQRLRQSILKWAFKGKLVDQGPTDEPATRLLERIEAERKSSDEPKNRGRRKTRSTRA